MRHCTKWSFWLANEDFSIWQDLCWFQSFLCGTQSFHLKTECHKLTCDTFCTSCSFLMRSHWNMCRFGTKKTRTSSVTEMAFFCSLCLSSFYMKLLLHCLMAHLTRPHLPVSLSENSIQTIFLKQWLLLWQEVLIHWCWSMLTHNTKEKWFSSHDKHHL